MDPSWPIYTAMLWLERLTDSFFAPSHNLRVIYIGVTSLGLAAGVCGCFLLFRKRSLLSDTIGHATLPGVALAFLLVAQFGAGGKNFLAIMAGALVTGWLSVRAVQWLRQVAKVREDAALAISLTVFYALGVVGLSVIQELNLKGASGLEYYLYGMVASMLKAEAQMLFVIAMASLLIVFLFFKELNSLCFDEVFVSSQGLPNRWLDELLMVTCLAVTIAGLQTVGLLLIMAMFIIPPATARLWTDSMPWTLGIAGTVGAVGALLGAVASSVVTNLPAGASIIVVTALLFGISMLFGRRKGWVVRKMTVASMERRLSQNQYLRAIFDSLENQQQIRLLSGLKFSRHLAMTELAADSFLSKRAWSAVKRERVEGRLAGEGLLTKSRGKVKLTEAGLDRAIEVARTHRLTELYLLEHADVAPQKVHQYVERIEEITTPEIANDLLRIFKEKLDEELIPAEPHQR
ncbi:MAG: metal ABC transporter permease [Verrucomicrobiota bacterium]